MHASGGNLVSIKLLIGVPNLHDWRKDARMGESMVGTCTLSRGGFRGWGKLWTCGWAMEMMYWATTSKVSRYLIACFLRERERERERVVKCVFYVLRGTILRLQITLHYARLGLAPTHIARPSIVTYNKDLLYISVC